uniref:Uncharacterized protein n=1 Tax=Neogobius melanostomus TaxID=47308 RepID=A0A8C6WHC7_9GOBI
MISQGLVSHKLNFNLLSWQIVLVLSVFAMTILCPAGWILHHLQKDRRRSH